MAEETFAGTIIDSGPAGYVEYEIDVERVLRMELPRILGSVGAAPLATREIEAIPESAKGAYVLYENDHPVYAGKTDTRHGFRSRLTKHSRTIQHRTNLASENLTFRAVRILVFSNFDVEAILIRELRERDPAALAWNDSGFGSNDPGHNREFQEPARWDVERPVDIDKPLRFLPSGPQSLLAALLMLKRGLPYDFRYETDRGENGRPRTAAVGHEDFRHAPPIELLGHGRDTLRGILANILSRLPGGWQVTVFPGRVILYKERHSYAYAIEQMQN
jgi:hypothetical protein